MGLQDGLRANLLRNHQQRHLFNLPLHQANSPIKDQPSNLVNNHYPNLRDNHHCSRFIFLPVNLSNSQRDNLFEFPLVILPVNLSHAHQYNLFSVLQINQLCTLQCNRPVGLLPVPRSDHLSNLQISLHYNHPLNRPGNQLIFRLTNLVLNPRIFH